MELSDEELVVRLRVAIGRIARQLRQSQAGGLTVTQLSALVTLEQRGPLRLTDLAAVEGITPSTLSRIVAPLEERGYLVRTTDPADRRSSFVAVSDRAVDVLARLRVERTVLLSRRIASLDDSSRAALAAALPALERLTNEPDTGGDSATGSGPAGSTPGADAGSHLLVQPVGDQPVRD